MGQVPPSRFHQVRFLRSGPSELVPWGSPPFLRGPVPPPTQATKTNKEEEMRKTLSMITTLMLALALAACGGDEPAGNGAAELPPAGPAQETSTAPMAPLPTSPQRLDLDALLTPQPTNTGDNQDPASAMDNAGTREPDNSARNNSPDAGNSSTNEPTPGNPGSNSTNPENTGEDITGLIPADAETNDRVLLQDIYARMDLSEFALDPRSPIPFQEVDEDHSSGDHIGRQQIESIGFKLNFADAAENPYLHVFPMLDTALRHRDFGMLSGKPSVFLHPHKQTGGFKYTRFASLDPVTYFIYHPWFEPIQSKHDDGKFYIDNNHYASTTKFQSHRVYSYTGTSRDFGAHWFGRNSTRGILSDAVAEALEQGLYPNAKPHPLKWYALNSTRTPALEERDWDLDDYLRTTIGPPSYGFSSIRENHLKFDTRNLKELAETYPNGSVYQTPWTTWEILHPKLPIVRVTSHQETILPLAFQNPPPKPTLTFKQENIKHRYGRIPIDRTKIDYLKNTRFSVSFTIAFQHRWTSFQDPNRRIVRFEKMYESQ